jgi:shikimate kinase
MKRIALIGPSGAGKTRLSRQLQVAEMDCGLDTAVPQGAEAMLSWIVNSSSPIITVSVHKVGLKGMARIKGTGVDERYSKILFVYLFCAKAVLEQRLRGQCRTERDLGSIDGTLNDFDEMNRVFRELADVVIDTTEMSPESVAAKVKQFGDTHR